MFFIDDQRHDEEEERKKLLVRYLKNNKKERDKKERINCFFMNAFDFPPSLFIARVRVVCASTDNDP